MSNTLLIRFPLMLSVFIVYRMHKVMRRMVNDTAANSFQKWNLNECTQSYYLSGLFEWQFKTEYNVTEKL